MIFTYSWTPPEVLPDKSHSAILCEQFRRSQAAHDDGFDQAIDHVIGVAKDKEFIPNLVTINAINKTIHPIIDETKGQIDEHGLRYALRALVIPGVWPKSRPKMNLYPIFMSELPWALSPQNEIERATRLYLWLVHNQFFLDANKRTAYLSANALLISAGIGMLRYEYDDRDVFSSIAKMIYNSNADLSDVVGCIAQKIIFR